mmetsp:Transcript_29307/g.41000  ORF Transcript_29307/g.41000 Transcript_29307/m.41000 type:complete len:133 (+) Transcript_29307:80-478(+)
MKFTTFGVFALLAVVAVSAKKEDSDPVMDRIKKMRDMQSLTPEFSAAQAERQELRMKKLAEMLEERKAQLEDHVAGRDLMNTEDHERVKRQIRNFQMKLDQYNSMGKDEKKERMREEAEAFRAMHRMDNTRF